MASIYDWSMVAANNGAADAQINYSEGMPPSAVNNSARQAMARNAELLGDIGGALTAGGTADALTVTANSAFTTYANGRIITLRIATDNTTAATLNVNGIGAKSIRKMLSSGESALTGGELQATGIYDFRYSEALNAGAGGWLLLNPTPADQTAYVTLTGTQTLTNKTLTSPVINTPTITGGSGSGMTLTTATLTTPTLTLKQSAAPTPTAEGDIQWDTDDNVIAVGDSAATKLFVPIPASTAAGDIEYFTGAKVKARLAKGTAGQTLRMNSGATAPEWVSITGAPDAVMEDQKASATEGGTFTSGAWRTRDLNTEVLDPSSLVSIAANAFTPTVAGWVDWSAPASNVGQHKTRLFNVTDASVAGVGSSEQSAGSADTQTRSFGGAPVVAGKAYRIEHQCTNTVATNGLGRPSGFASTVEVYTIVQFWRTA